MNEVKLSNISKVTNSSNGEFSIIIHNNKKSFTIMDSMLNTIYSKTMPIETIQNSIISTNSNFFLIYTKSSIYIFNYLNMSFKSFCDFKGEINNVIICEESKYIFIFTNDENCPIYIIYNIAEDFYNYSYDQKINNVSQYYYQNEFKSSFKIFSLSSKGSEFIYKAMFNQSGNRLITLTKDTKTNKNELKVFEVINKKNIQELQINYLFSINNFKSMEVFDFDTFIDSMGNDVLLLLWNDKILSKTYLNAYNFNIDK